MRTCLGNVAVLLRGYAYLRSHDAVALRGIAEDAILNANYVRVKLSDLYPAAIDEPCMHECVLQTDPERMRGVKTLDVAKRLLDYGFHAPTVAFPVHGTLMVEPTESEPLGELKRFVDAMINIRKEIAEIEEGKASQGDNVIKNAPHTLCMITGEKWDKPYSRQQAAFPIECSKADKYWPPVTKIDDAWGDRNLLCTCHEFDVIAEME